MKLIYIQKKSKLYSSIVLFILYVHVNVVVVRFVMLFVDGRVTSSENPSIQLTAPKTHKAERRVVETN